jgi:hypothetical protein
MRFIHCSTGREIRSDKGDCSINSDKHLIRFMKGNLCVARIIFYFFINWEDSFSIDEVT